MDLYKIIARVCPLIEKNDHVHAMWLEGSYATGKNNEQSDIDVWMDVDDGTFDACLNDFREKLLKFAEVEKETTRGVYSNSPKLYKQTFILRGYRDGQDIELDLQEHGRNFLFSRREHVIRVLSDKDNTIKWKD